MKFPIRRWLKVAAIAVLVAFASSTNLACSPDPAGDRSQVNASDTPVLLVSNSGSSGIERFDLSSGESLGSFVAPDSGGLTYPDDITADPDGTLYVSSGCRTTANVVCDKDLSAILRYDGQTGAFLDTFVTGSEPNSPLYRPYGTAFGPDGLLYVSSFASNSILRYDTSGALVDVFASSDSSDPMGLNGPNGLAFSPDGRFLYVTTEGDTLVCPGSPVEGGCEPEFKDYPSLVLRYSVSNGESTVFANPPKTNNIAPSLSGIGFGPGDRLYVSDFIANVVRVYDPETGSEVQQLPTVDSTMCDSTMSDNPYTGDLTFDPSGALLVAVGGQNQGDPGAVLRFSGEDYSQSECLVGPTAQLNRPVGIEVHF